MSINLINAEELGLLLGLGDAAAPGSAARAINVRIARGHPMPPSIQLPGARGRLWRLEVVHAWLLSYESSTRTVSASRRGGRPRKIDQIAAARSLSLSSAPKSAGGGHSDV